jgi:hypothetical protein
VADRKPFLLRLDPAIYAGMQRWADDELRSLNAQIEYVLRQSLREAGRLKPGPPAAPVADLAESRPGSNEASSGQAE